MFNSMQLKFCDRRIVDNTWWQITSPSFRPVFHIGQNRLHYVHSGTPTIYCDENPYVLEPGKLYFFPQNLSFRAEVAPGMQYDHTALDFFTFPPSHMKVPLIIDLSASPLLKPAADIWSKLIELHPMARYGIKHEYSTLIESYSMNLLKLVNKIYPIETVSDPFITDILNYIHDNYNKDLSLEELSDRTNYQKHFFIRKFKQIMGVTPYKYIKDYRMNNAFYLIQMGKFSIAQVAEQVGYSDTSGFSHAFKQHFGIYPNEVSKTVLL